MVRGSVPARGGPETFCWARQAHEKNAVRINAETQRRRDAESTREINLPSMKKGSLRAEIRAAQLPVKQRVSRKYL
jgi:hypothetical protein